MQKKTNAIIVIGGTYDARQIVDMLTEQKFSVVVTVATSYGNELVDFSPCVNVIEKRLSIVEMCTLIKDVGAKYLIDASHPYALLVSQNAIIACENTSISYVRYERKSSILEDSDVLTLISSNKESDENIIYAQNFEEAAEIAKAHEGNILTTTGSKNLDVFIKKGQTLIDRMFVRILPDPQTINELLSAGFSKSNIIALKGPFSIGFNMEMIKHIDAKLLITKDSGDVGGTLEKIEAAKNMNIKTLIIKRPSIEYPIKFDSIENIIMYVKGGHYEKR